MEQAVVNSAAQQGLWALLFVTLLVWVLKENNKREERLLNTLETLSSRFEALGKQFETLGKQYEVLGDRYEDLGRDVAEIRSTVQSLAKETKS
jgi:uncharacterized protein YoxC